MSWSPGQRSLRCSDDDEQAHADLAAKRRATALLVFCDHALKRLQASSLARSDNERAISQELLVSLLAVSTEKRNDPSYVEVAAAARTGMVSTLGVMSASDFVAGVLTMLESGSVHVSTEIHTYLCMCSDSHSRHRAAL